MNLFLESSARDPVFMPYAIQLLFKILFHPCGGGIQSLLGYVVKAPLLAPRKDAERQGGGTLGTLPWLIPAHHGSHQPIKDPSAPA